MDRLLSKRNAAFKKWIEEEGVDPGSPKGHYMMKGAYLGFCAAWELLSNKDSDNG